MKSGRYTVKEILNESGIGYFCIPEIQRDYVWGEAQVRPLVESMLKTFARRKKDIPHEIPEDYRQSFAAFLSQMNRYNIGFIYAYYDKMVPDRFFLIDGQQRLITLYLLLAVLSAMNDADRSIFRNRYFYSTVTNVGTYEDYRNFQLKVDYKVRETAHVVLQHLIFDLSSAEHPAYIETLLSGHWDWQKNIKPEWWQQRFIHDLTVKSLFNNAALIAAILNTVPDKNDLFAQIENGVEIWYFDTNLSLQGEELYVYMNSRGEQLNYNENRRASCLALCESAEEKAIYASRWDNELQNYFFQQRHGNSSADKGLDLFLHTVEMLTLLLDGKGGKMEEKWRDFIVAGYCADYPASIEIVKEYLHYRQALKVYTRLNGDDQEANAPMIAFLSGEWGNNKSQIDAISIFVSLELLKGQTYISEELKQNYFNCRLFFKNLYRHASEVSNPQNYIVDFLKLARILRENSLDILILPQVQNPLLTAEEKWRLHFLERRKQILGVEDVYKTLVLLDDISSPTVLRGEVTILFAVAFNGNGMDEILNGCMSTSFDELNMKLTQAKEVMCRHFNWTSLSETVRKLLLYGECFITRGRGMWYPCDLGLNARSWIDYWYDRMRPSGDALMVNEHIVSFLRMNGALPENNQPVDVEFSLLQQIASNDLAGQRFFDMVRNDSWTEGRFRSVDGWKPEFKGYKSILWFLSEEIRQGISHDGIRLNIDYRKGDAEQLEIVISKPAAEGTEPHADIVIPFRQEGDWEQYQLNEIIKSFRETGQF